MGANRRFVERVRDAYDLFTVYANRNPWFTLRRVLWIATAGWWLACGYIVAACGMVGSIIFCPFAPQAFRLAFDLVEVEAYVDAEGATLLGERPHWTHDPLNPWCIAANVTWLLFFGWGLALGHITTALIQAVTIIGIPTAITNIQLAKFALWPYGQSIRRRPRPTTIEELHRLREARQHGQLDALLRPADHDSEDDALTQTV